MFVRTLHAQISICTCVDIWMHVQWGSFPLGGISTRSIFAIQHLKGEPFWHRFSLLLSRMTKKVVPTSCHVKESSREMNIQEGVRP